VITKIKGFNASQLTLNKFLNENQTKKKKLLSMQINNFMGQSEIKQSKESITQLYFKQEKEDVIDASESSMP
jgi:hypothetical protein